MRVLTFLHSFEPGGVERDALRLNAHWAQTGVDTCLVMGRRDGRLADEFGALPHVVLQRPGHWSTARFETLWMIAMLPAAIRRLRPDVLFCAGNTYSVVAVALRLILGRACPPIVLKVSNDLERRDLPMPVRAVYHWWLRRQAGAFDAIVAMAPPARAEIEARMHVAAARIHVIENASLTATDIVRFAAARDAEVPVTGPAQAGRRFLAVGRLVAQKNFTLLLDAFAHMARGDDRLVLIGEGPERRALERRVARLDLSARVAMPGHANPLYDAFAVADALVLSSDYEGLGVVVVEALAAGVPIVATDCSVNMRALVATDGAVVPTRDVAALARALDAITRDAVGVPAMRRRAATFTVEATAPRWITLFKAIIG